MGGACAGILAGWARLSPAQRRLLMACGGGAGLAAVYNVPLGGALFTAEVMMGSISLPIVLPALACSGIATVTAWLYLPSRATYLDVPGYHVTVPLLAWALLAGPLIGVIASGYIRLIGWVSHHQASGRWVLIAPAAAFGVLALIGFAYPQLFGNGKDMAHDAFLGSGGLVLLLALFALKPLVTALCLGSGASGGLFTPTLSTGAVLGGCGGYRVEPALAGVPGWRIRPGGGGGDAGGGHAGAAGRAGADHGAHPRGLRHHDPAGPGDSHRHRGRPAHRRVLDLLRAAADPPASVIRVLMPAGSCPIPWAAFAATGLHSRPCSSVSATGSHFSATGSCFSATGGHRP